MKSLFCTITMYVCRYIYIFLSQTTKDNEILRRYLTDVLSPLTAEIMFRLESSALLLLVTTSLVSGLYRSAGFPHVKTEIETELVLVQVEE